MMNFHDQLGNLICLEKFPQRIISLVPSQTELLFDLGLGELVVGITKFCIHPKEWFETKARVGGTKSVDIKMIKSLRPDLIIGNKEENTKEDIEALMEIAPVWMSDIYTLEDALEMIASIGSLTNTDALATTMVSNIRVGFNGLKNDLSPYTCAYFIWKKPYYLSGKNTFIDALFDYCNLKNFTAEERYPEWKSDSEISPQVILLSSEPYPFKQEDVTEMQKLYPNSLVLLVDGEMFSWYGSRLLLSIDYLQSLKTKIRHHFIG